MKVSDTTMTTDMKTYVVNELCISIADVIKTALNDYDDEFPYLTSTIQLLEIFHSKGIEVDLSIFTDTYMDNLYNELRTYLSKSYKLHD